MTNTWQAIIEKQRTLTFDDASSMPSYAPLPQLGILQISGDDAQSFLQNLLTNDVTALEDNQSQLSGLCSAKGRLLSIFTLIRRASFYQIVVPRPMIEILQPRLSMYILRSNVVISNESDTMMCLGFIHSSDSSLSLPDNFYLHSIQTRKGTQRHLCVVPHKQSSDLLNIMLKQQWQLSTEQQWEQYNIQAEIPTITPETKEKFTPQQVNLDLVGGVSFSKGCYPGQEIVARLHYLGTPSRRMSLAEANISSLPVAGDEVKTENGGVAGHIVCAQYKDENTVQFLASLKLNEQEKPLFIQNTIKLILK